jgi:hypothetical protein
MTKTPSIDNDEVVPTRESAAQLITEVEFQEELEDSSCYCSPATLLLDTSIALFV